MARKLKMDRASVKRRAAYRRRKRGLAPKRKGRKRGSGFLDFFKGVFGNDQGR